MNAPAVLSLGAGVQSTTMLLMAAAGELEPLPELAIFADTGWEPTAVYEHLDWLEEQVAGRIEIARVSAGNLREDLLAFAEESGRRYASPPLFVQSPRGGGMLRRQCTREYKIVPIERELRRRGFGGRGAKARRVEQWVGISFDELERMKPTRTPWIETRWPLVERRITRLDCVRWFRRRHPGRSLVRSACIGCPYHSDAAWREVRSRPAEWADVVEVDARIRSLPAVRGEAFLHRSRRPLTEVDLTTPEERGQLALLDGEGFVAECEGMCGL